MVLSFFVIDHNPRLLRRYCFYTAPTYHLPISVGLHCALESWNTAGPWHMRFFRLGKIRIFQIRMTEIQVSRYVICLNLAYADFHQSPSLLLKISMNQITISISQIIISISQIIISISQINKQEPNSMFLW